MYRTLEAGDTVLETDELWNNVQKKWVTVPANNVGRTLETPMHNVGRRKIPDPSAPLKSFTPNKYTRNMPTLDGRTVPVDVYCVLAAFPTGSAAVDHAIKKLLAPGQRGHKDRIQDLKEARASLTRAIELEEAQNA